MADLAGEVQEHQVICDVVFVIASVSVIVVDAFSVCPLLLVLCHRYSEYCKGNDNCKRSLIFDGNIDDDSADF